MTMLEPFTERARRSIVLAQEEAHRLASRMLGTEHILLGIVAEGGSMAASVLKTHGVDAAKVRHAIETTAGGRDAVPQALLFSPRAKRAIELAFEEARSLDHNFVGTETLLLGIIREKDGLGARILENLGADGAELRAQTIALLRSKVRPPANPGDEA